MRSYKPTRIYASKEVMDYLRLWGDKQPLNQSVVINRAIGRYHKILKYSKPDLAPDEWGCIIDILVEWEESERASMTDISLRMIDAMYQNEDITTKWAIDVDDLTDRFEKFSPANWACLLDVVDRHIERKTAPVIRAAMAKDKEPELMAPGEGHKFIGMYKDEFPDDDVYVDPDAGFDY